MNDDQKRIMESRQPDLPKDNKQQTATKKGPVRDFIRRRPIRNFIQRLSISITSPPVSANKPFDREEEKRTPSSVSITQPTINSLPPVSSTKETQSHTGTSFTSSSSATSTVSSPSKTTDTGVTDSTSPTSLAQGTTKKEVLGNDREQKAQLASTEQPEEELLIDIDSYMSQNRPEEPEAKKWSPVIFRKPTSLPEDELLDTNRPIEDTHYLAEVLKRLPENSARKEPLILLSHQVVEQFGLRLVRTSAVLQEIIVLGSIPDAELLHKILQQFINLLDQEAALDVDLLEGLAVLLETAHPVAVQSGKPLPVEEKKQSITDKMLSSVNKSVKEAVGEVMADKLNDAFGEAKKAATLAMDKSRETWGKSKEKIGSLRQAMASFLREKNLIMIEMAPIPLPVLPLMSSTSSTSSTSSPSLSTDKDIAIEHDEKQVESKSDPQKGLPRGSALSRYNQINLLLSLFNKLIDKYLAFHRQSQTAVQEAELLRALARVLDAMRDIGITGIHRDKVRIKAYDALLVPANDTESDPSVSLWANYAIQALIRLDDGGFNISEWLARGKQLLTVIKSLKEVWNSWDLSQLGTAYSAAQDAFRIDHQPESWYEALWYCQLLIRTGDFQGLEEYLYKNKADQPDIPLCSDRCMPAFQLGLIATLDAVLQDVKWSDPIKASCLQLLQDLFLNENHWHVEPQKSRDPTWRAYFQEKAHATLKTAKKLALYRGKAYQARKEAVQGAILDQLVRYLNEPRLCQSAQAVLSALRHPSIKLTPSQSQLLEEYAPLAKILKTNQTTQAVTPAKPNQVLFLPAREAVEKHLIWKLETLRAHVLASTEADQKLAYYVPPKSLRKAQDKDPPFDLMEGSLYFLGLIPDNPAQKQTAELKQTALKEEEFKTNWESEPEEEEKYLQGELALEKEEEQEEPLPTKDGFRELTQETKESKENKDSQERKSIEEEKEKKEVFQLGHCIAPVLSTIPTTIPAVDTLDLSRCTLDCRRMTGIVDPGFVAQWRRTYSSDVTRFLLIYCEEVDSTKKRRPSQIETETTASGSWYFCGQTGEGEYLEGSLQADSGWLNAISDDARTCLTQLARDLSQFSTADPISLLQDSQVDVTRKLKQDLLKGLHHLIVVNRTPPHHPSKAVLLLTAGAGSGKSTYGIYLQRFLWQQYQSGGYIPLFIPLVQLARPDKPFIEDVLKQKGLTDSDIRTLKDPKNGYPFLFIFDGYDELTGLKGQNLFAINKLHEWPHCRMVISCRAEVLSQGEYETWFAPTDERNQLQRDKILTHWVAPFDNTQTQTYLKKYVRQKREQQVLTGEIWDGWTDWQQYQDEIDKLSSIRQLIERPFMLTILVDILPAMKRDREESLSTISRLDLYDMFMQQWFKRAKDKLTPAKLEQARLHSLERFQFHEGEAIAADYQEFCENLALYLYKTNQSTALYQRRWIVSEKGRRLQSHELDRFFKTSDPGVQMVLKGCPITPQGNNRYGYIHKSLWEYFVACRIYRELSCSPVPWEAQSETAGFRDEKKLSGETTASTAEVKKQKQQKLRLKMRTILPFLSLYQKTQERRAAHRMIEHLEEKDATLLLLNQRLLNNEPSIVQFLANYAERDERFQRKLLHWVYCSRKRPELSVASANAITILNVARFPFSGMDLSKISIPGADLSKGIFDHTNFRAANLRGINLDNAFLRKTNFSDCNLKNAFLDKLIGQKVETGIEALITSAPKKNVLFICDHHAITKIYDIEQKKYLSHELKEIRNVDFTSDGNLAFLVSRYKILLFDLNKKIFLDTIPCTIKVEKIAISKDCSIAFFYSVNYQQEIEVYDIHNNKFLSAIANDQKIEKIVLTSDNSKAFIFSKNSKTINLYDIKQKILLDPLVNECEIEEFSLTRDGSLAFLSTRGKQETLPDPLLNECEVGEFGLTKDDSLPFLSTSGNDNKIEVYDITQRKTIDTIKSRLGEIEFSNNGGLACIYNFFEKEVIIYNLTERAYSVFTCEKNVSSLTFTCDNEYIFLTSNSKKVQIYDIKKMEFLSAILCQKEVDKVAISSQNLLAFFYHQDGIQVLDVYDFKTHKQLTPIQTNEPVKEVIFSDKIYCIFYSEYNCYKYNLITKESILLQRMQSTIGVVQFLHKNNLFIQSATEGYHFWDWETSYNKEFMSIPRENGLKLTNFPNKLIWIDVENFLMITEPHESHFSSEASSHSLSYFCTIRDWQVFQVKTFITNAIQITANREMMFLYDGTDTVTHNQVYVYIIKEKNWIQPIQCQFKIKGVALSADSKLALIYGIGKHILIFDIEKRMLSHTIICPTDDHDSVCQISFAMENKIVFISTYLSVIVYNIESKQVVTKSIHPLISSSLFNVTITSGSNLALIYKSDINGVPDKEESQVFIYDIKQNAFVEVINCKHLINQVVLSYKNNIAFYYRNTNNVDDFGEKEIILYGIVEKRLLLSILLPETVNQIITVNDRLALLYCNQFRNRNKYVYVYDMEKRKLLDSIPCEEINDITLTTDHSIAFFLRGREIFEIYNLQEEKFYKLNLKGGSIENHLEFQFKNDKSFDILILYGSGGCCIWFKNTNEIQVLLKDIFVMCAAISSNGKYLIAGLADGTCRLWDISGLFLGTHKTAILKSCSDGLTMYTQDVMTSNGTTISKGNADFLMRQNVLTELMLETKGDKNDVMLSNPSSPANSLKSNKLLIWNSPLSISKNNNEEKRHLQLEENPEEKSHQQEESKDKASLLASSIAETDNTQPNVNTQLLSILASASSSSSYSSSSSTGNPFTEKESDIKMLPSHLSSLKKPISSETKDKITPLVMIESQFEQSLVRLFEDNGCEFIFKRPYVNTLSIQVIVNSSELWADSRKMESLLEPAVNLLKQMVIGKNISTQQFEMKSDWENGLLTITAEVAILDQIARLLQKIGLSYFPSVTKAEAALFYNRPRMTVTQDGNSPSATVDNSHDESLTVTCAMQ